MIIGKHKGLERTYWMDLVEVMPSNTKIQKNQRRHQNRTQNKLS